jgi:hypothetical protein
MTHGTSKLALACALVPALAVHLAWWLSLQAGHVPDCIPHLEGCTSISRAARHGTGNLVFRLLMVPCAMLQAILWWRSAAWLQSHHGDARAARSLPALGTVAAVALAVYAIFLGTDGAIYGWMRRFGITFYFGASFLAMAVFAQRVGQMRVQPAIASTLAGLCAAMLCLGVASLASSALAADDALKDRLENVMEWLLGAMFTLWFLAQAAFWRRQG